MKKIKVTIKQGYDRIQLEYPTINCACFAVSKIYDACADGTVFTIDVEKEEEKGEDEEEKGEDNDNV